MAWMEHGGWCVSESHVLWMWSQKKVRPRTSAQETPRQLCPWNGEGQSLSAAAASCGRPIC